jgi:hypothetical protein
MTSPISWMRITRALSTKLYIAAVPYRPKIANKHCSKVRHNSQVAPCNKEMVLFRDDPKESFHDFRRGPDL